MAESVLGWGQSSKCIPTPSPSSCHLAEVSYKFQLDSFCEPPAVKEYCVSCPAELWQVYKSGRNIWQERRADEMSAFHVRTDHPIGKEKSALSLSLDTKRHSGKSRAKLSI